MVITVYVSGISPSKEVKKRQQRALLILDSLKVDYKVIDITEPGNEEARDFFKVNSKKRNLDPVPLPPQFFNNEKLCGDWDDFFAASDEDTVYQLLGLQPPKGEEVEITSNGHVEVKESEDTDQDLVEELPRDEGIVLEQPELNDSSEIARLPDEEEEIDVLAEQIEQPEIDEKEDDENEEEDVEE